MESKNIKTVNLLLFIIGFAVKLATDVMADRKLDNVISEKVDKAIEKKLTTRKCS